MKAAVEMEMHAAVGTRTVDKGATLDKCFPAYDELLDALKALHKQAIQSELNSPNHEWGMEAISMASTAIAKAGA